jgi:hypothetical protein
VSRWTTPSQPISELTIRLLVSGPEFVIVSFIVFLYLFFTLASRSEVSKLADVILTVAESLSISASAFIVLFIVVGAGHLLRGDWIYFAFAFGFLTPHLLIAAVLLPLLILLYQKLPGALLAVAATCAAVLALAVFEPGLRARFRERRPRRGPGYAAGAGGEGLERPAGHPYFAGPGSSWSCSGSSRTCRTGQFCRSCGRCATVSGYGGTG